MLVMVRMQDFWENVTEHFGWNHLYSVTLPLGLCAAFCSTASCLHLTQKEKIKTSSGFLNFQEQKNVRLFTDTVCRFTSGSI